MHTLHLLLGRISPESARRDLGGADDTRPRRYSTQLSHCTAKFFIFLHFVGCCVFIVGCSALLRGPTTKREVLDEGKTDPIYTKKQEDRWQLLAHHDGSLNTADNWKRPIRAGLSAASPQRGRSRESNEKKQMSAYFSFLFFFSHHIVQYLAQWKNFKHWLKKQYCYYHRQTWLKIEMDLKEIDNKNDFV